MRRGTGSPPFFDLLNAGKQSVVLDLRNNDGRTALRRLLLTADVVIESSRPRALEQLGVVADELMRDERGPDVWISITGHGRIGDAAQRVAFGDDAAVAGGLVVYDESGPCFSADAIADPLTGMVAAATAIELLQSGRGDGWSTSPWRTSLATSLDPRSTQLRRPCLPRRRRPARPTEKAPPLGRDTRAVLEQIAAA